MIRRGGLKFIHSPADPDQLYDVAARSRRARQSGGIAQACRQDRGVPRRDRPPLGSARRSMRRCARASGAAGWLMPALSKGEHPRLGLPAVPRRLAAIYAQQHGPRRRSRRWRAFRGSKAPERRSDLARGGRRRTGRHSHSHFMGFQRLAAPFPRRPTLSSSGINNYMIRLLFHRASIAPMPSRLSNHIADLDYHKDFID